ncbi:hypothetical protein KL930_002594 [Ogataea haglerorum]|nr:hypothetical protein KL951_002717 [Ogataea haglerorum]KAG7778507.1 hypothetical protein KL930_002594 [Ogataea haglerorum]KAG7779193.1 hypothetical protein KL922_001678 [Ogataea haglerorum]
MTGLCLSTLIVCWIWPSPYNFFHRQFQQAIATSIEYQFRSMDLRAVPQSAVVIQRVFLHTEKPVELPQAAEAALWLCGLFVNAARNGAMAGTLLSNNYNLIKKLGLETTIILIDTSFTSATKILPYPNVPAGTSQLPSLVALTAATYHRSTHLLESGYVLVKSGS